MANMADHAPLNPSLKQATAGTAATAKKRRSFSPLTQRDKVTLAFMLGVPAFVHIALVWLPTLGSVVLSFTRWNGIGGLAAIQPIGIKNYHDIATIYPPFWPALQHNLIWLGFFLLIATPFGMFLAVLLDREIRGSRFYQGILFLPVILSLAIVGFIWELIYAPEQGLINNVLGRTQQGHIIDWLGNPHLNLWAILVASGWRQAGYIMILYLSGLKSVDPTLREAASVDGANAVQTFFRVVFPALQPINIVVLVVTVIESLRAFDIVYVINKGTNGLELLSVLVTNNIIGEASRVGFGSALAVILLVISVTFIIIYLTRTFQEEDKAA